MPRASIAAPEPGSFLSALSDEDARALAERAGRRRYERGMPLFHERQASDSVMVVLRGRVKVTAIEDGKETVLAIRGPGDLLGELSAIDGEPRSATVIALEPVEALVVGAPEFKAFLRERPEVALLLLRTLSRRLREAARREAEFVAYDTVGRVSARLLELSERFGEPSKQGIGMAISLTQEELAGMSGSSLEAVQKALHTLRACGWIRTERRRIVVLDPEALRRRWT